MLNHSSRQLSLPFLPNEYVQWINSGVVLALMVGLDVTRLRRSGLINATFISSQGFQLDVVGHLAGYCTGTVVGWVFRQSREEWRDLPRQSFWYWWTWSTR